MTSKDLSLTLLSLKSNSLAAWARFRWFWGFRFSFFSLSFLVFDFSVDLLDFSSSSSDSDSFFACHFDLQNHAIWPIFLHLWYFADFHHSGSRDQFADSTFSRPVVSGPPMLASAVTRDSTTWVNLFAWSSRIWWALLNSLGKSTKNNTWIITLSWGLPPSSEIFLTR